MTEKDYDLLVQQTEALAQEDPHFIPLFSNVSALIYQTMTDINRAGFYLTRKHRSSMPIANTDTKREKVVNPYDSSEPKALKTTNTNEEVVNASDNAEAEALANTTGEEELVRGPFQGKVACIHIKKGHGVCGTSYEKDEQVVVKNVHDFPGHIACDAASLSEIVTPIHDASGIVRAVLDIDSPKLERFSDTDARGFQKLCELLDRVIVWEM